jgi:hypothetical protein
LVSTSYLRFFSTCLSPTLSIDLFHHQSIWFPSIEICLTFSIKLPLSLSSSNPQSNSPISSSSNPSIDNLNLNRVRFQLTVSHHISSFSSVWVYGIYSKVHLFPLLLNLSIWLRRMKILINLMNFIHLLMTHLIIAVKFYFFSFGYNFSIFN